ncbi:Calcineurin-like phosphoesterase domain-containing protein [Entamoeba marina]
MNGLKRICVISDSHTLHDSIHLLDCDILICCGDFSSKGKEESIKKFAAWLNTTPSKHRVIVTGNHDYEFQRKYPITKPWFDGCEHLSILDNEKVEIDGITIFGCFYYIENSCFGNYQTLSKAMKGVDIFVSHEPPHMILDDWSQGQYFIGNIGDRKIKDIMLNNGVQLHCFGHSHACYGCKKVDGITYINAALCAHKKRELVNAPFYVDWKISTNENVKSNIQQIYVGMKSDNGGDVLPVEIEEIKTKKEEKPDSCKLV